MGFWILLTMWIIGFCLAIPTLFPAYIVFTACRVIRRPDELTKALLSSLGERWGVVFARRPLWNKSSSNDNSARSVNATHTWEISQTQRKSLPWYVTQHCCFVCMYVCIYACMHLSFAQVNVSTCSNKALSLIPAERGSQGGRGVISAITYW